jgi:hypothetical protein
MKKDDELKKQFEDITNVSSGNIEGKYYSKFILDNRYDLISDHNELYSFHTEGIELISVSVSERINEHNILNFTKNFSNKYAKLYTLYKLNSHMSIKKFLKSAIPFMNYQYKLNVEDEQKMWNKLNKWKKILNIINMKKIIYKPPYDFMKPRTIEYTDEMGNIQSKDGFSNEEQKRLNKNKLYKQDFNKKCKTIIDLSNNYGNKFNIDKMDLNEKDYRKNLDKINDNLLSLKNGFDKIYLIKEKKYVILNKKRLFYVDKEYHDLSIEEYNINDPVKKKRMIEIERLYLNKGIYELKKKQNINKIENAIELLNDKEIITMDDLVDKSGLSKPTIRKWLSEIGIKKREIILKKGYKGKI